MLPRATLVERLATVSVALADHELVPVLKHFWFTGTHLLCYNETIGISVPCETDFRGAVPATLLDLLKTSKARDVELISERDNLTVKAGSSRFKLSTLPTSDFIWEMERMPDKPLEVDGPAFVRALKNVQRSLGNDKARPEYQGVTVILDKSDLLLYTTDRDTLSYAHCEGDMFAKRAILPAQWCKAVLAIAEKSDEVELEINDKFVLLKSEGTMLYGLLIEDDENGPDFVRLVDGMLNEVHKDEWTEINDKLDAMLDRATVIMRGSKGKTRTKVDLYKGKLRFLTVGDNGEVEDSCIVEKHPDCKAAIDPARVREGLEYEQMAITASAVMFKTPGVGAYLVSGTDD